MVDCLADGLTSPYLILPYLVFSHIDIESDAFARVLDDCNAQTCVFYRVLASKMMLSLVFWTIAMVQGTRFSVYCYRK